MDSDKLNYYTDQSDLADDEKELYEHFRLIVDKGQSQLRIDKFLVDRIGGSVSRNKIQNAIKADSVLVNNKPIKQNYKIKPCDEIVIVLPKPPLELDLLPENIPLDIVYEDKSLLVVDKKAGMVVHPGYNNYEHTLLNALLYHFQSNNEGEIFPLLVHRIDKDTSGLLVVAKEEFAQTHLAKQFYNHTTNRLYYALVWGDLQNESGVVSGYIARSQRDRRVMTMYESENEGKWSLTNYKVIERFGFATLVECKLETGRTHQIRAHMKHIGHPLFADEMYGGKTIVKGNATTKFKQFIDNCFEIMPRQALHAAVIGFVHPENGKELYFKSQFPQDFSDLLEKIRKKV